MTGAVRAGGRVAAATLGAALLLAAPGLAEVKAPPDIALKAGEASPGPVTFSHATHLGKVGKCTLCHMRDFKMKRGTSGPITLEAKQQGRFCGACHDGKTTMAGAVVFPIDECDRCHK